MMLSIDKGIHMAKTKEYRHFCAAARTLEVIGEKWSLLIVRDLLRGPQRFSDLLRYLGAITPKWLTLRLRELEAAGIVERDAKEGRREVWYLLTEVGRDLEPVVEALIVWGIKHAMRPPLLGERVHPEIIMSGLVVAFNNGMRVWPPEAVTWVFQFGGDEAQTLNFDGQRWSTQPGADREADVTIETTPEAWAKILTALPVERQKLQEGLTVRGDPARVQEFVATCLTNA